MNVSDLIDPSFSYRLIATLMHFLWQGCLVALLAVLGDGLLSRASASRRYALHVAVLAIMVACVAVTFLRIEAPVSAPAGSVESMAMTTVAEPIAPSRVDDDSASMPSTATPVFVGVEPPLPESLPVVAVEAVDSPSVVQERPDGDSDRWRRLQGWAPQIALLYFVCCGLLLARLIRGTWVAHRLRRMATSVSDDSLIATLQRQAQELGLRVLPRIAWCAEVSIPLVIGVLKPMILLPAAAATGLSPDQLQALITHELAHIRRYDLLVNLVQRVVESLLFFHPAVWFISRRISNEREQACDELVLATGCERLRYADALVRMAELSSSLRRLGTTAPATSLAASGANSSEFKRRVLKVLSVPTASHLRPSRIALLVIVALIVGVTVSASRLRLNVFADTQPKAAKDSPSAGRGSPDPALDPTAGLPNSDEDTNKNDDANGDLRSDAAAGSGDPRRAQVATATVKQTLRITGRVVDAETGKVIEKIRMIPTSVSRDDAKDVTWQTQYLKDFIDGRFVYETDRPWDKTKLRIEAEGYLPAMTRIVNKGEVIELDVKLKRAILSAEVRLPSGERVAKAQVVLATWTNEINITDGKLAYGHHGERLRKVVETDEQGRFVLPAEIDPSVLVVAHEAGYAEVANAEKGLMPTPLPASDAPGDKPQFETRIIELQPWGRVEGRVLMGDKPVVGAKYSVYQARTDDVHVSSGRTIVSDAEGRFVVEHLPPGRHGTCQRFADGSDGKSSYSIDGLLHRFDVPAGKTTTLELGGRGRIVTGTLALPEGFPHKVDWSKVSVRVALQPPRFSGRFGGKDESGAVWSKFVQSDEGKLYGRSNVAIAADGSFRIEGLPAAEYQLVVSASGDAALGDAKPAGQILSGSSKFSVPAVPLPDATQPIDLGPVDLKSLVPLTDVSEWGRGEAKNGLRARVVPVLASMSEDAIDPTQRVTKFAKADDVAFVVELENVSDKPIKLLDTRYGDGYGKSKGKANSDWLGEFLCSVDLFDQEGKLLERPDVQVVSADMMLGSALVATVEPGKTHRLLLRPAKWLSPFKLPLKAGRYRAAVRYHGMPERVATRIKEYRPDSEALAAVAGDVVTATIAFEVSRTGTPARLSADDETGKSARPTANDEAALVWGEPDNGLRAAMSLAPTKAAHAHGEKPEPKLHIQNVSDKPIVLASPLWLSELTATVKNDKGEALVVGSAWYSGITPISRVTLKPQQVVVFDAGNIGLAVTQERAEKFEHITHRTLVAPAATYSMQLAGRFGNSFLMKDGKGKILAPLEGDYIGELKTGATPLTITNELIECDIVDAVTGKPIADTTTSFIFIKPKSGDVAEEIVANMIWGPKGPGRIYFAIPDQVMQRADREELEVRWGTGSHPDYDNNSPDARIPLKQFFKEGPKSARETLSTIKLTPKKKAAETSLPKGLEFLKPYPKLHGLSLDMTEPQFLEIVKQQELKTRKTVEGEKVTHRIALGDGHTLIVMFDKEAKCSGIQRVRGADAKADDRGRVAPQLGAESRSDSATTRDSATTQPQSKESRALFQQWQRTARSNGNIPGGTLGPLVRVMRNFVKNNPTHEGAPKFAELLKRIEVTRDWSRDEAVKLLDEVAAIYPSLPDWVQSENNFSLGGDVVVGKPLPEELKNAPWGEAQPNGLRVAWLLEPRALKYRLGTPLKSRILFHNAGKNSIVFRALTWNQSGEHKAHDAQGTEININSTDWTTIPTTFACRLAPNEFLEVVGAGIGVGANNDDEDWRDARSDVRVGSWIEAKAGDEVTFSPAAVDVAGREGPRPEGEEAEATPQSWWLKFIKDRLSHDAPLPAAADERRRLLDRAVRDLFGNGPTPEEITAFTNDAAPEALDALAQRLANRAGFVPFSGSLKSGTRKFLVLPPDPDAAKKPRSAKGPGQYSLGGATFVVTRRPIGERVVNEAHLSFSQPDATKPARKSHPVPLPDDYDSWIAAWMRGGTVLWVAQKGADKKESIRRYDFTNPESVKEAVLTELKPSEALPQAILDLLSPTSPRAGRGSPDPALDPTAGLPNSDDETKTTNNANGDLRSDSAAGSGDPRRAQDKIAP